MYCLTCGYKLEGTSKFCPECGSRLEGNVSNENPKEMDRRVTSDTVPTPSQSPEFPGVPPFGMFGMLGMQDIMNGKVTVGFDEAMRKINSVWSFEYSTSGMMFRSGVTYRAWKNEDKTKTYAQVRLSGVDLKDAPVFEVSNEFADHLEMILEASNADAWDGFNGHAEGVMDGDSFSFSFRDGNGRKISAGGYMAWPDGFGAARVGWDALFYGEYDKHFPNYAKRLQDYLNNTVFPQYGKCEPTVYEVHYISDGPESFSYSESSMTEGVISYRLGRFTQPKANDDTDRTWIEALLLRSFKKPFEADPSYHETGLMAELYRSDAEGVRKISERLIYREIAIGNEGDAEVLFREIDGKTVIGIYRKITYHYGKTYKAYYFKAYDCIGGTWNELGYSDIEIPARETVFKDEDLARFTEVMRTIGLSDSAVKFLESKEDFKITENYTRVARIAWFTNLNSEFPQKVKETEPKKEIDGYWIKICIYV